MRLNEYQADSQETAVYPGQGTWIGLVYTMLGLGEAGELQGKAKKLMRDDGFQLTEARRDAMIAELGDVLWYAAAVANELDIDLERVAQLNLNKLADRADRGVLQGSGDYR